MTLNPWYSCLYLPNAEIVSTVPPCPAPFDIICFNSPYVLSPAQNSLIPLGSSIYGSASSILSLVSYYIISFPFNACVNVRRKRDRQTDDRQTEITQ